MVEGPGNAEMTGAVVSVTLMVWLAVLELPHGSVAVQVRVTEYFCGQDPGVVTSAKVSVGVPPHGSVAVQVRVTEYFCGQEPGVVTSAKVKVDVPPQASVAVGVAKEGVAGHWMVEGPGSAEMTGAVLSSTVM